MQNKGRSLVICVSCQRAHEGKDRQERRARAHAGMCACVRVRANKIQPFFFSAHSLPPPCILFLCVRLAAGRDDGMLFLLLACQDRGSCVVVVEATCVGGDVTRAWTRSADGLKALRFGACSIGILLRMTATCVFGGGGGAYFGRGICVV